MAIQSITEIDLDINQPGVSIVHAKQYDTVRKVKAHLFYNGVKWLSPSSNYVAVVAFKKSDRIGGFYDHTEDGVLAVSVDSSDRSIIYIALDRNVLTTAGNVVTEVTFYDVVTLGRLSTFSFITQVELASIDELDLSSNPYFNILAEDIRAVLEAEAKLTGVTASASGLPAGSNPTVTVTGGQGSGNPYNFAFGLPKGDTGKGITQNTISYAVNTDSHTIPTSGWVSDVTQLTIPDNAIIWTRVVQSFSEGSPSTWYAQAVQGSPGPTGIAVQTTEPITNVKAWIDPDDQQYITIPDAFECNPLHFSATISSFPYTFTDARLTSQMRVINCAFGSPQNLDSYISWTTETDGTLVLTGSLKSGTTTTVDIDVQTCVV